MKKLIAIILLSTLLTGCGSIHMVYYLKDNESTKDVAKKFNVKAEDIKADGRYLMFEVR